MEHEGAEKGEPSAFLPAPAFVSYIENHDQAGNRPFGDRIAQLISEQAARTLAAIILISPQIPLVFMGEEWAADEPFLFFSNVGDDLADAIRESREEELKDVPAPDNRGDTVPGPMAELSFRSCKLDWSRSDDEQHARFLSLYRQLIALRSKEIVPRLFGMEGNSGRCEILGERAVRVVWKLGDGSQLTLVANLSTDRLEWVNGWNSPLWLEGSAEGSALAPWSAVFTLES